MILEINIYIILITLAATILAGLLIAPLINDKKLSVLIGAVMLALGFYFLYNGGSNPDTATSVYNLSALGLGFGLLLRNIFGAQTQSSQASDLPEGADSKDEAVISISNITKDYLNGVKTTALKGVDLKINKGEFVAIMGASGSGKSTLMHILGLLDTPTSGGYRLAGREVSRLKPSQQAEVRNHYIGFVFQQFNLLPRTTVLDNILLPTIYNGGGTSRKRALSIINKVGLADRVNHKSNQLSGGQIQRVAIARALMMNPHIILADEPTGNLDSKTAAEIMALFEQINQEGTTIIMVTHEEDIAKHARRVIRLKDGLIISDEQRN